MTVEPPPSYRAYRWLLFGVLSAFVLLLVADVVYTVVT